MPTNPDKPTATSRRLFAKALIPAIGFALVSPEKNQAQRQKKRKPKKDIDQTSPITVGGGAGNALTEGASYVSIYFDQAVYKKHPNHPNRYWRRYVRLHKFWVTDHYGKKVHHPTNDGSVIIIHCLRNGDDHDSPITVRAHPLSIEFEGTEYPYDPAKGVFYCLGRRITTIDISRRPVFEATQGTCNIDVDDP